MTIKQAIFLINSSDASNLKRAAIALDGLPEGGWPETAQAIMRLTNELPVRSNRDWSVRDLIKEAFYVDHAMRYRLK